MGTLTIILLAGGNNSVDYKIIIIIIIIYKRSLVDHQGDNKLSLVDRHQLGPSATLFVTKMTFFF